MASGVRCLYVDVAGVSDCAALGYESLRREYTFERVTLQLDFSESSGHPTGSLLVCSAGSVREFVEQFPFLSSNDFRSIATHHKVLLHSKLRRRMCLDALRGTLTADLVTETVAYIDGDHSERSRRAMKATTLAHALNQKRFLVSRAGSNLMNDNSAGFLTAVFPHLDPWGIGAFNHPARRPEQQISFQRQLRNMLQQVGSPFARDASFPFICWNILQKRVASENSAFCIPSVRQHSLVNDIHQAESSIRSLADKLDRNPKASVETEGEKGALRLFRELNVICRSLPGSDGYKLCRRNEIRSLTRQLGTPTFFL